MNATTMASPKKLCLKIFVSASVFHLAAAACIFSVYGISGSIAPDTSSYVAPALELAQRGTFSVNGIPETLRTPGYPLFLALFTGLPDWELFVVAAQCLITGWMAAITYKFAEFFAGARAGCFAAIVFTVSPLTVIYTTFILTERLSSFLTAILCAAMFKFLKKPATAPIVLAAAAAACGAFVRPAAMFIPYGVAAFIVFYGIVQKIGMRKLAAFTAVFLLVSLAPIKLWEYRNFLASGFKGFSSISAVNLYFYNAAGVLADLENKPFSDIRSELEMELSRQKGLSQGEMFNFMERKGKEIIKDNLYAYLKVHLAGALGTMTTLGASDIMRGSWGKVFPEFWTARHSRSAVGFITTAIKEMPSVFIILALLTTYLVLAYPLSILGFAECLRAHIFETVFLALTAAYFILIPGPAGYSRFRQPVGFIIAIWAGAGIDRFLAYIAAKRKSEEALPR
jgi:hypothetical protein